MSIRVGSFHKVFLLFFSWQVSRFGVSFSRFIAVERVSAWTATAPPNIVGLLLFLFWFYLSWNSSEGNCDQKKKLHWNHFQFSLFCFGILQLKVQSLWIYERFPQLEISTGVRWHNDALYWFWHTDRRSSIWKSLFRNRLFHFVHLLHASRNGWKVWRVKYSNWLSSSSSTSITQRWNFVYWDVPHNNNKIIMNTPVQASSQYDE